MGDHEMEPYLLRIASGDKDALRQLYDAYSHAVFLLALSILKHREQAEDVMQNVFLKIWAGAGSYRKGSSPKAWIMGVTRNEAIDSLRKGRFETIYDGEEGDDIPDACKTESMEDAVEDRMDMEEALSALNEKERQVVLLRIVGDLTYGEIAGVLSIPLPTAVWRYKNSLKKLETHLLLLKEAVL